MMALQAFSNVPVMPVSRVDGHVALGGPIWPDFDRQVAPRHCRGAGIAVDLCPPADGADPLPKYRKPATWGGFLDTQFGHLIAEHLSRVLPSVVARPRDITLFTLPPGGTEEKVPGYVWQLFDWFGLERRRVRFVTHPALVPELRVAAQGDILGSRPPDPLYLDLLDDLAARRDMGTPGTTPVLFVTRAGMTSGGSGGHLGESYLLELLSRLEVPIFDPGRAPIRAQLEAYHGARSLIFSEGSAIHGRQLLGRLDQDIHVLRRRPSFEVGLVPLTPRCRAITHHATAGRQLKLFDRNRAELKHVSCAFYDTEALLACFDAVGVDLRSLWRQADYLDHAVADAEGWLAAQDKRNSRTDRNLATIAAEIAALSQAHPVALPDAAGSRLH